MRSSSNPPKAEGLLKHEYNARDPRTTAELRQARFSGLRANDLANQFEIWILGNLEATVTYQQFHINPNSLNMAYCEVFGLHEAKLDDGSQAEVDRIHGQKKQL